MDHKIEIENINQPHKHSNFQDPGPSCADSISAVHQQPSDKEDGRDSTTTTPTPPPFTAVDLSGGAVRWSPSSSNGEKVCRICHLSGGDEDSSMGLIELGCACKDELGISHYQCAHAWFSLKRTRTCEICGKTAKNVDAIEEEMEGRKIRMQPIQNGVTTPVQGHASQLCVKSTGNFLLTCLILAFFLPWVIHFHKPW